MSAAPAGVGWLDDLFRGGGGSAGAGGQFNVTLANGLNSNVNTGGLAVVRVGGPTGPFSVGGITTGGTPGKGQRQVWINTTTQPMTWEDEDAGSSATNRIRTLRGVRITQPAASSAAEVGWDDTAQRWTLLHIGTRMPFEANVRDFGAHGDGVADDGAAVDAACAAAVAFGLGAKVVFPPGTYYRTTPWVLFGVQGLHFEGAGLQTKLSFAFGASYTALTQCVDLKDCQYCVFENLFFEVAAGNVVESVVRLRSVSGSPGVGQSLTNRFVRCLFSGNAHFGAENALSFGGSDSNNTNNDSHYFENCTFREYGSAGVLFQANSSESFCNTFVNCLVLPSASPPAITGAMGSGSTTLTCTLVGAGARFFDARDVGKSIQVANAAAGGGTLTTTITGATGIATVTLADANASGGSISGKTVTYGSQIGYNALAGGSSKFVGGQIGGHLDCDIKVGIVTFGDNAFDGMAFENSVRFLRTQANGNSVGRVSVKSCRIAGDRAISGIPFLDVTQPGIFTFQDCALGEVQNDLPIAINWKPQGASASVPQGVRPGILSFTLIDCTISSTKTIASGGGAAGANLFTWMPPRLINCRLTNASTAAGGIPLGEPPMDEANVLTCSWGYAPIIRKTITANATFTFNDPYVGQGQPMRMVVNYSGGAWTTTWPGAVKWGAAGAPGAGVSGKTDVFEFTYDGTTFFGSIVGTAFG